jgi:hypothetical protein
MGGVDVFTIFFGLFWAAVMASASRYRLFATHLLTTPEYQTTARRRLLAGILILDAAPIVWFVAVAANLPIETDWWSRAAGAIAALSVFGFTRILHAVVYTRWRDKFYGPLDPRYDKDDAWAMLGPKDRVWSHLWAGLAYLVITTGIVWLGQVWIAPVVN